MPRPYFDKEAAPDEVRSLYETLEREYGGTVPTLYKAMIYSPEALKAVRAFYTTAMPSWKLDRKLHALAHIRTAMLNSCDY